MSNPFVEGDCVRFIGQRTVYRVKRVDDNMVTLENGCGGDHYNRFELAVGYNHTYPKPTEFTLIRYKEMNQPITPYEVREHDSIMCRCCGFTAPMKDTEPMITPGNVLDKKIQRVPDLSGWMVIDYPFRDPYHMKLPEGTYFRGTPFKKKSKLCPKCAKTVMGTVVHLSTPGASR